MDNATIYLWWPFALLLGLALFSVSFIVPAPRFVEALRVLSGVCFMVGALFVVVGVA